MLQNQGSVVVNGQLVSQAAGVSQYVNGFAPYSAVSPATPLTIPPMMGSMGGLGNTGGTITATADSNAAATANAQADPFNPKVSPVIPALVALALALFFLHAVHFRDVDGGGSDSSDE
jgi:hypothetical protein